MKELLKLAENRQGWRSVVQNAFNPQIEDGSEQNIFIKHVSIFILPIL